MSPNATSEAPILAFKKCLFIQGQKHEFIQKIPCE